MENATLNEMISKPDKFLAEDSDLDNLMLRYVFKRMLRSGRDFVNSEAVLSKWEHKKYA